MAYEELPITPALITWARARAGISIEDASKSFKRIQAWEDGRSFPTHPQLELLADAFKVPIAVFFFPSRRMFRISPRRSERTHPDTEFDQIEAVSSCSYVKRKHSS